MERNIKLIWDFYGADSLETAKHHAIHLEEYAVREKISHKTGFEELSKTQSIAFIAVKESDMIPVRDALIPKRGEIFEAEI